VCPVLLPHIWVRRFYFSARSSRRIYRPGFVESFVSDRGQDLILSVLVPVFAPVIFLKLLIFFVLGQRQSARASRIDSLSLIPVPGSLLWLPALFFFGRVSFSPTWAVASRSSRPLHRLGLFVRCPGAALGSLFLLLLSSPFSRFGLCEAVPHATENRSPCAFPVFVCVVQNCWFPCRTAGTPSCSVPLAARAGQFAAPGSFCVPGSFSVCAQDMCFPVPVYSTTTFGFSSLAHSSTESR
jgi:hypothetical protein